MKIPDAIANVFLAASLALQAWTLSEIVALKVSVARLQGQLEEARAHKP